MAVTGCFNEHGLEMAVCGCSIWCLVAILWLRVLEWTCVLVVVCSGPMFWQL